MQWGELLSFEYGKPVKDKERWNGRYPVFGTNGQIGTTDLQPLCPHSSFIVGRKGAYRGVHYSDGPFSVIDTAFYAEIKSPNVDTKWAYYKFLTYNINSMDSGSAIPSTDRYELYRIPVELPTLAEQKKAVAVLTAIDDKIKANNKVNDNLLQQVIALFNNAYESATSEAPFTSIVQVLSGGTPKTDNETFWNGAIPFFTPKDVGTPYTLTTEKYITGEGLAHCNSRLYPTNTTFVTARGTVGKVSLAGCPMAMNQSCYALGGIRIHPLLVYCYTLQVIDALKHKATGAVFDAITVRDFNAESIKRIDCECESQLLSMIEPMFSSILTNSMENQRLMTLRNTLLPKIMSGEIAVSAVELGS